VVTSPNVIQQETCHFNAFPVMFVHLVYTTVTQKCEVLNYYYQVW